MNILYGVAGVGFGHSSRAMTIAGYLESLGHKVKIITYGDGYTALKDKFDCVKVRGLEIIFKEGKVDKSKTINENIGSIMENLMRWNWFKKMRKEFSPDLCISDMEPIVPIIRHRAKLPLICVDNQHRLTNLEIDIPKKHYADYLIAKKTINLFVKRADKFIVSSFGKARVLKKNTVVVPPIVRPSVLKLKPKRGKKILVYLSKSDKKMLSVLKDLDEEFVVYGFNQKRKKGNIEFKKKETFLKDLGNCKAVIGTAGFSLMSEAIYLNKPYLAIPLRGQFEQVLNGLFLKEAGFGDYAEELTEKEVVYFLYRLRKFEEKLKNYKPDQKKLFKEIDKVLRQVKPN